MVKVLHFTQQRLSFSCPLIATKTVALLKITMIHLMKLIFNDRVLYYVMLAVLLNIEINKCN